MIPPLQDMMIGSQGIDDTDCMLKCQPEGDCRTMTCCDNQTTVKQRRRSSTDKGRRKSQPQTPPAPTRKVCWWDFKEFLFSGETGRSMWHTTRIHFNSFVILGESMNPSLLTWGVAHFISRESTLIQQITIAAKFL